MSVAGITRRIVRLVQVGTSGVRLPLNSNAGSVWYLSPMQTRDAGSLQDIIGFHCLYWVDKSENFQNAAKDKMKGWASPFSSELNKQGTNQAIGLNITKQLIPISRVVPMLFLQCQTIADNWDPVIWNRQLSLFARWVCEWQGSTGQK